MSGTVLLTQAEYDQISLAAMCGETLVAHLLSAYPNSMWIDNTRVHLSGCAKVMWGEKIEWPVEGD